MESAVERIPVIRPGATIGVLGGGQLGRMLALAARSLGYHVKVLDPEPNCPARAVADKVITAKFDDADAAEALAMESDVITVEIERISREALERASKHCPTRPSADVLALARDRRVEKGWLNDHGFQTAPYRVVASEEEMAEAVKQLGASVAKTATEGYDGRGQARMSSVADVPAAWKSLGEKPCVVEAWLPLDLELSVIVARSPRGEVRTYPPALNHHEHQILDWSVLPGPMRPELARRAEEVARKIASEIQLEGLLAIEFFALGDGRLLVNEMAPRPHNSGHPTTEACLTSQFEQLVRACCNLPLGSTEALRPVAIANLLGDLWAKGQPPFEEALAVEGVTLHLYGKESARPGRKMGHLSATARTAEEAVARAIEARRRLESAARG
jgi:5-(carboxyamino)imidazole ribonucleotide synthase